MHPRDVLGYYLETVEDVRRSQYIVRADPISLKYNWVKGRGLAVTLTEPGEQVLKSFLVDFRKFFLTNDPANFLRVCKIIKRCLKHERYRQYVQEARSYWMESLKKDGISFIFRGKEYLPEQLYDLWINGKYFHNEPGKRKELRLLEDSGFMVHRAKFQMLLHSAVEQVFYVEKVVRVGLAEGYFHFPIVQQREQD